MKERHYFNFWGPARIIGLVITGIVTAVVLAFLFGWFVMLLWNWLMPSVFHVRAITYWEGWGLVILASLLFKGNGFHMKDDHGGKRRKREKIDDECDEESDDWSIFVDGKKGSWKEYSRWWKTEGKENFREYVRQEREKKGDDASGSSDGNPGSDDTGAC